MALINQNSIIGVTSITSLGASNVLTVHTSDTTERLRVTSTGLSFSGTNSSLDSSGNASFNGNVSIGGTLTYEDVTNIDSVGIITAQAGINVTGGSVGIGTDNPEEDLHIASNSPYILLDDIDNSQKWKLKGTAWFAIEDTTAGVDRLRITSDGYARLTTANARLEWAASSGSNPFIRSIGSGQQELEFNTGGTERLRIASDGQSTFDKGAPGSANQVIARFQAESSRRLDVVWHDSGSLLGFDLPGSHSYIFKCSGSERLRITSDGDVEPGADATQDLGSATKRWANIYSADLQLSNEGAANDVDGTWGKYTIQEGEEDLFLINKRSGKKYKFMLQEVN